MKKVFTVVISYTLFFLAVSIALSLFVIKDVPELLPGVEKAFMIRRGVLQFAIALPALILCSFMVGWAIEFGKTADKVKYAFHSEIFSHFAKVMITSIVFVFILSLTKEVAIPVLSFQQKRATELPQVFKEYKNFSISF